MRLPSTLTTLTAEHCALFGDYLPLAMKMARRFASDTPGKLHDFDDTFSAAMHGLLLATTAPRRSPERARFGGYARKAIRFAMIRRKWEESGAGAGSHTRRGRPARAVVRCMSTLDESERLQVEDSLRSREPEVGRDLELAEEVEAVLGPVDSRKRKILVAHYIDGKNIPEICREFGISGPKVAVNILVQAKARARNAAIRRKESD